MSGAPATSPVRAPNNIPLQLSSFVGRAADLEAVTALIQAHRLVTVTGFGGVGKTRLALRVADRIAAGGAGGVYVVDLSALRDPLLFLDVIAASLGVRETGDDLLPALARRLDGDDVLLVVDNMEQVLDASSRLLDLLAAAPTLRVLATSREPLQLRGEREYALEPLAVPARGAPADSVGSYDAVALFVERAREAVSDFSLDASSAATVASLCAKLDGLPLAIELAAARVKALPPKALLDRLGQQLELPGSAARDLPDRHQTLRATIAWSLDLLGEAERELLVRGSVFVGGADVPAIDAVCGPELVDTVSVLTSLVNKSLLLQRPDSDGEPRYTMLQTVQHYAAELLDDAARREILVRHADYYRALVADRVVGRFTESGTVRLVHRELDNLRAALDHFRHSGQVNDEAQLLADLADAVWHRGHWDELIRRSVDLLERMPRPSETSFTLLDCVAVGSLSNDLDRAYEWSHRAIAEAAALGRPVLEGRSWVWLAHLHQLRGELDEAEAAVRRGLELAEGAPPDSPRYRFYDRQVALSEGAAIEAGLAIRRAQWDVAAKAASRALQLAQESGDVDSSIRGHVRSGGAALGAGRLAQARAEFAFSVELCRSGGVRGYLPLLIAQLADVDRRRGDLRACEALLAEAVEVATELEVIEPLVALVQADAALDAGHADRASALLAPLELAALADEPALRATLVQGRISLAGGDLLTGRALAADGIRRCVESGMQSAASAMLRLSAHTLSAAHAERRMTLLAAAAAHENCAGPVFLRGLVPADDLLSQTRLALGERAAPAEQAGSALTLEECIALLTPR